MRAMQIADAVGVIGIAGAGNSERARGKRGTAESKGDCKGNYGFA